jgi:hypothetical protein
MIEYEYIFKYWKIVHFNNKFDNNHFFNTQIDFDIKMYHIS